LRTQKIDPMYSQTYIGLAFGDPSVEHENNFSSSHRYSRRPRDEARAERDGPSDRSLPGMSRPLEN
jgi:hypothetical protein